MKSTWIGSTNFQKGRAGQKPEAIVIHIMAGTLKGTDAWFNNPKSQVSSHYGVGEGGEVHQYVKEGDTAWANGRVSSPTSKLVKKKAGINPNYYTISIENEGKDLSKQPGKQIEALAELVADIAKRNKIPLDREHVIGHYEIFSPKPNCPSTKKEVLDRILALTKPKEKEAPKPPSKPPESPVNTEVPKEPEKPVEVIVEAPEPSLEPTEWLPAAQKERDQINWPLIIKSLINLIKNLWRS